MESFYAVGWLTYLAASDQYTFAVRGSLSTLRAVADALAPLCQVSDHFIDGDSRSLIVVLEREYAFSDASAERTMSVIVARLLLTVDIPEPAPEPADPYADVTPYLEFVESLDFERVIED